MTGDDHEASVIESANSIRVVTCDTCSATETIGGGGEVDEKTLEGDGWYLSRTQNLCPDHNDESEVA